MPIWDQFDVDPAKNTKTPPLGAPEGGTPFKRGSDIFRQLMASLAETRELWKTLKSLAFQDSSSVAITGGSISGVTLRNSTIEGVGEASPDATKVYGLDKQAFYNMVYPVGRTVLNADGTPPVWPGVVGTWQLLSTDRYLKAGVAGAARTTGGTATASFSGTTSNAGSVAQSESGSAGGSSAGQTGIGGDVTVTSANSGSTSLTTGSGGGFSSGTTGGTTLTLNQSPAGLVTNVALSTASTSKQVPGSPLEKGLVIFSNDAGGNPHTHTVPGQGGHTHSVSLPDHDHNVTIPGHTHPITIPAHTHLLPSISSHNHGISGSVSVAPEFISVCLWLRTA